MTSSKIRLSLRRYGTQGIFLGLSLFALSGCLNTPQDPAEKGVGGEQGSQLMDATHGGARIQLPSIDPAALLKTSVDTTKQPDSSAAWFDLTITGSGMTLMHFTFSIGVKPGGNAFEIKGIPAGPSRKFLGKILDGNKNVVYEGSASTDVVGGQYSELQLRLGKASGSVGLCVIIEGQPLPPCAIPVDTIPPVPVGTIPLPGSNAKQQTLCFDVQFDYGECLIKGFAKMDFVPGTVKFGYIAVRRDTALSYYSVIGSYDSTDFTLDAVISERNPTDSLRLKGKMSARADGVKGEYVRLFTGKKGIWNMSVRPCADFTLDPPNPKCPEWK